MSDEFVFWTHGVAVIPEYTTEYTGKETCHNKKLPYNLYMKRTGQGTFIRQTEGTCNWFHFAIPSATKLDNDNVSHFHAWLRVRVNNSAIINAVHIWKAQGQSGAEERIYNSQDPNTPSLNETGQHRTLDFDLPDDRCEGPLVMCVHVSFNKKGGELVFEGAGARFEEWA